MRNERLRRDNCQNFLPKTPNCVTSEQCRVLVPSFRGLRMERLGPWPPFWRANLLHFLTRAFRIRKPEWLDTKLNPWAKFEPNFLTWLLKGQIEKTTVHLLFSLFIQFSAIEMRWVFSHAKLLISSLQWKGKRWGAPARWWAIAIFQLTELNIKANPPCF